MKLRKAFAPLVVILLAGVLAANAQPESQFLETNYYLVSLGQIGIGIEALADSAQTAGYPLIEYDGNVPTVFAGGDPTTQTVSEALDDEMVLMVDNDRFLLRRALPEYEYAVRPSELGYELVISPLQGVSISDTLTSILLSLQELGILGDAIDFDFATYAKDDLKGPPPPAEARIDSALYKLVIAEDWYAYAAANALDLTGLRVEVVAEKLPGGSIPEAFEPYVVEESDLLGKLLLPIDELVALASAESIGYVRTAYVPVAP